jgi:hypothetical protein
MKTYKAIQSNPNSKGGFVTKLQCESIVKDAIFGDKVKKDTLYISGTNQVPVGTEVSESALFPKYHIVEHPMINPETQEEFMSKWLHCA